MNIILLLFFLQAFCLVAGFGVAYSLLKRTSYSHLCVLVAPIIYPVCLVVLLTFGGHKVLQYLPPVLPVLLAIPFLLYSAFVVWQHRAALISARHSFRTPLGVLAASTILALPLLAPDIAHQSLTYTDNVWNNELLNYAALASYLMGRTIHGTYAAVYQQIAMVRGGADLLLASLANALDAPPANCLSLLMALFRAQAITAFGFLVLRGTHSAIAKRPWLLYSGIALFSLSSLELLNYSVSFLNHYQVAPIVILLVSFLLFQEDAYDLHVLGLMVLLYLYLYISYPEIVVVPVFIQAVQALSLSYHARSVRLPFLALSPPVIAAALNPMLTIKRFQRVLELSRAEAGFQMFTSPRDSIVAYFGNVLGLRSFYLGVKLFDDIRVEAVVGLFLLICLFAALWFTVWYQRQYWGVAGALILVGATVMAWRNNPVTSGIGGLYKSEKMLIYGNFMLMGAFVFAVFEPHNRKLLRVFITAGYVLLLVTSFRLSAEVASRFGSWAKTYAMTDVAAALKTIDRNGPVWLPGGDAVASMYWDEILQYYGVSGRHGDVTTHRQMNSLFDYASDEAGVFEPVSRGQTGTFIVSTAVNVPYATGWLTLPLSPMVSSAKLLYHGSSFAVYSGSIPQTDLMVLTGDIVFPLAPSGPEPLVTGGIPGNGFFIYAQYSVPNLAQIGYAVWGTPSVVGAPFDSQPGRARHLRIVQDSRRGITDVFIDDKVVLHRAGLIRPLHLMTLTVGENQIGGGLTGSRFTGEIRNVRTGEPSMEAPPVPEVKPQSTRVDH